jgi:hypothetical protein
LCHAHRIARFAICWLLAAAVGCNTHAQRIRDARQSFYDGNLARASELLEKSSSRISRDASCLQLDRAMLALVDGRPEEAERSWRELRDEFDYLEQQSLAESTISLLTDDRQRAYAGEDYEKVLIRAFLALSSLMRDGQDADAYILQVDEKQREIIQRGLPGASENPKLAYKQVAFGPYLRGVLSEATHTHYDDAARSFAQVVSWEPGYQFVQHDLLRAQHGAHSQRGNGVVYVFALVGRGPVKEETIEAPTSDALLIADRLLSAVGKYQLPPTIAPIKVPLLVIPPNEVNGVLVQVGGHPAGISQTVTDVGQLAVSQQQAVFSHLVARAVVRRVVKKAVAYGVQDAMDVQNQWLGLGIMAAGVAWEFTESADLRNWALLPDQIQVLRMELPAGMHPVDLSPTRNGVPIGLSHACHVPVLDGQNTYVLACFPTRNLVGRIQVSDPNP